VSDYEAWWSEVSPAWEDYPPFVLNEDHEEELLLTAMTWIGSGGAPWTQGSVKNAAGGTRTHAVRFDKTGRYRFQLRRWPREDGGAIDGQSGSGEGKAVSVKRARVSIAGVGAMTKTITPGDAAAVIEMDVPAVETTLETAFLGDGDEILIGAYYVYISRVGDAADTDGDGVPDVVANYRPPVKTKAYDLLRFSSPADMVAGRNATVVGQGPQDTVAIMSDGKTTYRLDEHGHLWRYDVPELAGAGTKLGSLFAAADVHALMADASGYFVHLAKPSAGYEEDAVVEFASVADLLSGKNGKVATRGSSGSTALMCDGQMFYKMQGGVDLLTSSDLDQLITVYGSDNLGKLFCGNRHTGLFSDGTSYYVQVTSPTLLRNSGADGGTDKYEPTWESLVNYEAPEWYEDARVLQNRRFHLLSQSNGPWPWSVNPPLKP
jgi:hypothetical protein